MLKKLVKKDRSKSSSIEWNTSKEAKEELDIDNFTHKDWRDYFISQYEKQGRRYIITQSKVEHSKIKTILVNLMKLFVPRDIKLIIDFIFESDQDIVAKPTASISLLSSSWINSLYQNATLWEDGKYKPKKEKQATVTKTINTTLKSNGKSSFEF